MRVTSLGHASLVVEAADTTVFTDPVFFDPFEVESVSCPRREVTVDALPRPDAIVLSHAHLDHFDAASLARLPRSTPVYIPPDARLRQALQGLEFWKVKVLLPWEPLRIGALTLMATPSKSAYETGLVVRDEDGALWNQVDTVVTQATTLRVLEWLGGDLDVVFSMYSPLIEYGETWVSELGFPRERYDRLLEVALSSQARVVVPHSSGQRLFGSREWANRHIFPASRERFLADLAVVAPEVTGLLLDPGEALELRSCAAPRRVATGYAHVLDHDTQLIAHDPAAAIPPLTDPGAPGLAANLIDHHVSQLVGHELPRALEALKHPRLSGPLRRLWDRRARLEVEVVTPTTTLVWHLVRWMPEVEWAAGASPEPDYTFTYVGSELVRALTGQLALADVQLRAVRHRRSEMPGSPFRLQPLDPARLHGVDVYESVDEIYGWSPLMALVDVAES